MAVIATKGIAPLKEALIKEPDDLVKAAACFDTRTNWWPQRRSRPSYGRG